MNVRWISLFLTIICGIITVYAFINKRWFIVVVNLILYFINGLIFFNYKKEDSNEKRKNTVRNKTI